LANRYFTVRGLFPLMFGLLCMTAPWQAQSAESRQAIEQQLEQLQHSPEADFVPKAIEKVRAYLGASMLAADRGDTVAEQTALNHASTAIDEAYGNARFIMDKFANLLQLQAAAKEAASYVKAHDSDAAEQIPVWLGKGDQAVREVFKAAGAGELNSSQQRAGTARAAFTNAINAAIPVLLQKTEQTLKSAANKNAKSYTPVIYGDAKNAYAALKRYADGIASQVPLHPALSITLAKQAVQFSLQVKEWRKQSGSHEELLLSARRQRQDLASALGMDLNTATADYSMAVLLDRVNSLKSKLTAEKKACTTQLAKITSDAEREQATTVEKLLGEQQSSCIEQLATLKDAFRAKLERVTYEDKRKKSVQQLFETGEVEIHSNMDGSLLLRLTKLKFSPGKVELNSQHFEFLSRVKEALTLYDDRLVSINGHTDNQGDVRENQTLSLKRAEAVMDYLISSGIGKEKLKAFGYGEIQPIASNEFARGRDMNRRIDIVIEAPVVVQDDAPQE